jgi:hypothetical protein
MQVGQWVNDGASLLATTSEVDFDPNAFLNALGAMLIQLNEAGRTMQE